MSADNVTQVLQMLDSHCQDAPTQDARGQCLLKAIDDMTAQSIQHVQAGGLVLASAAMNCHDSPNFAQCSLDHAMSMQEAGGVHMAEATDSYSPPPGNVMVDRDMPGGPPRMPMY